MELFSTIGRNIQRQRKNYSAIQAELFSDVEWRYAGQDHTVRQTCIQYSFILCTIGSTYIYGCRPGGGGGMGEGVGEMIGNGAGGKNIIHSWTYFGLP